MSVLWQYAIGRLTDDPVVKQVGSENVTVCNFSIAVNLGFGEKEKTEYVDCVAWRKLGDIIGQHCKKGRKVFIAGIPQKDSYDVTKGSETFRQYRTYVEVREFEFCDSVPGGSQERASEAPASNDEGTPF
jgi:single-strand DNA-binding protein